MQEEKKTKKPVIPVNTGKPLPRIMATTSGRQILAPGTRQNIRDESVDASSPDILFEIMNENLQRRGKSHRRERLGEQSIDAMLRELFG
jgi:hypothetical protein